MHRLRWLRIIIDCIISGKSKNILAPEISTFWITPFDVEFFNTFSHTYFSFQALGRWKHIIRNFSMRQFAREMWAPYTFAEIIRFQRALKLFAWVRVETRLFYWDDKMVYYEHKMLVNGELAALGYSRGAMWSKNGRIAPIEMDNLNPYEGPIPDVVVAWCKTDDTIKDQHTSTPSPP